MRRSLSLFAALALVALALPARADDAPRVVEHENVVVTVPAGWTSTADGDRLVLIPPGVAPPQAFMMIVTAGVPLGAAGFEQAFKAAWDAMKAEAIVANETGIQSATTPAGREMRVVGAVMKQGDASIAMMVIGVKVKDRLEAFALVAESEATLERFGGAAIEIATGARFKSDPDPGPAPAAPVAPAAGVWKVDLSHALPAGWESTDTGDVVRLEKWENKGETFYGTERHFQVLILPSQPLGESLRKTFLETWAVQVKPICETSILPLPMMRRLRSGRAVAYDVDIGAKNKAGVPIVVALHLLCQGKRVVPIVGIHSGLSDGLEVDLLAILESAVIRGAGSEKLVLFDRADLVGEWVHGDYSMASYVTPGGGYAGDASIALSEALTLRADGSFKYAFRAVRGGGAPVIVDDEGKWSVDDEWLVLAGKKEESRYRLFGVGADPKVGAFLVRSKAAVWAGGPAEQLDVTRPRAMFAGTWFKRKQE